VQVPGSDAEALRELAVREGTRVFAPSSSRTTEPQRMTERLELLRAVDCSVSRTPLNI
jgi:hypothetical protein